MALRFLLVVESLLVLAGGLTMQVLWSLLVRKRSESGTCIGTISTPAIPPAAVDVKGQNEWAFSATYGSYDMCQGAGHTLPQVRRVAKQNLVQRDR